ncbi:selenocysteine-specific translation elongation factor [Undibacterium terreum]|uniref:Selenocysteine-specific elongation factor n=1 Tax=Undibacterium terreum TaxID=1224302 RepID=A0A916UP78_9BURK|nr:selenocysteine-specific translation elongation factor [Undibacterium terreum]GGC78190.1 selenocysteine-specific translation factor [Undibacterium terreum]
MIVGTAGHIDHGKTTLTRALTGVDTDRLKEEKARGISIELGYAYTPLPNGDVLGLIDVPGHEKLIHTMAAGASGIDYALLVIAVDDGIMPQTREHLAILQLLGVRQAAVVLTKIDRADATRIAAVEADIASLLAGTLFAGAPVFRTQANAEGNPGVASLKQHLEDIAQAMPPQHEKRLFRLAIDRVFTLSGHGTIIAGTALAGSVRAGDELLLAPSGKLVRVRSIHAQNRAAETGLAGQRLALNLAGIEKENISRGDWILAPAMAQCSDRLDVELDMLADAGVTLKPWSPVHVHLGAAHRTAHVLMLDTASSDALVPGQHARAQLVFDAPVHAVPGDRFVLRNAQASRTIGGGRVLDPFGPARKRRSPARHAWLDALRLYLESGDASLLLQHSPLGLSRSSMMRLTHLPAEQLHFGEGICSIPLRGDDAVLISTAALEALANRVLQALRSFHEQFPDEMGPQLPRLKRIVEPDAEEQVWKYLIQQLGASGRLIQQGPWLRLPEHATELKSQEQALADKLMLSLLNAGFDPPWVRDLAKEQRVAENEVRDLLRKLAMRGQVYQVVRDLFYHPQRIAELSSLIKDIARDEAADGKGGKGKKQNAGTVNKAVDAAGFRDASGLGRKRAIQLLEFFDRVGYTRRLRDTHILRADSQWQANDLS